MDPGFRRVRAARAVEHHLCACPKYLMERLRQVDKVAFVRFASVYRDFKDASQFMTTLKNLLDT